MQLTGASLNRQDDGQAIVSIYQWSGDMNAEYQVICEQIMAENQEMVGVSYHRLDCGCMQFCGISREGQTVGCRYHLSGQPPTRNLEPLVCLKCRKDSQFAIERTVDKGIVWSAGAPENPERLRIERKVLGTGDAPRR